MAKISIIIPCYNVEQYIEECMESIIRQSIGLAELEIVLVNDASTDHTLARLQAWEEKYPDNILVINYEENLRQGGARNVGLQYASADYVGFVDADDYIAKDMYAVLYDTAIRGGYDAVYGRQVRDDPSGFPMGKQCKRKSSGCISQEEAERMGVMTGDGGGVFTGLYRRSIIMEEEIFFPEKCAYEDNFWKAVAKLYYKKSGFCDQIIYHYRVNQTSTVNTRNQGYFYDRLAIEIAIVEEYKKRGFFAQYYSELEFNFIKRFYLNTLFLLFTRFDEIPDIFGFLKEKILTYFPEYRRNPRLERLHETDQAMLKLLEQDEVTAQDLQRSKQMLLQTIYEGK